MTPRWTHVAAAVLALAAFAAGVLVAPHAPSRPAPSRRTAVIVGPFELTDQDGRRFTRDDLLGKPTLMVFGVTHCPGVCHGMLSGVTRWVRLMGSDGGKLRVVFVSLDPERDTPATLRRFLRSAASPVTGLTGTAREIRRMRLAYGVAAPAAPSSGRAPRLTHPAAIYLIDSQGRFVAPLAYGEPPAIASATLERLVRAEGRASEKEKP